MRTLTAEEMQEYERGREERRRQRENPDPELVALLEAKAKKRGPIGDFHQQLEETLHSVRAGLADDLVKALRERDDEIASGCIAALALVAA